MSVPGEGYSKNTSCALNLISTFLLFGWLVSFMMFNATFNNISVICQFYWWRKPECPEKTTDLPQVTDKLDHIMLYTSAWAGFELTTSEVIGTDCIGSCVNPTTIWSRPRRPLRFYGIHRDLWDTKAVCIKFSRKFTIEAFPYSHSIIAVLWIEMGKNHGPIYCDEEKIIVFLFFQITN